MCAVLLGVRLEARAAQSQWVYRHAAPEAAEEGALTHGRLSVSVAKSCDVRTSLLSLPPGSGNQQRGF